MSIELKMPALSPTMEEGTLAKWLVKPGDVVKSGDILAEIETDKATMEFEAVDEGTIAELLVAEGTDNVKVGTVIATINAEGAEASPPAASAGQDSAAVVETPSDQRTEDESASPAQDTGTKPLVTCGRSALIAAPMLPVVGELSNVEQTL